MALNVALIPLVLLCGCLVDITVPGPVLVVRLRRAGGGTGQPERAADLSARLPVDPAGRLRRRRPQHGLHRVDADAFFAPAETSASLNLGYVFIALGALLTPVLTDILLDSSTCSRTLVVFACLCSGAGGSGRVP